MFNSFYLIKKINSAFLSEFFHSSDVKSFLQVTSKNKSM